MRGLRGLIADCLILSLAAFFLTPAPPAKNIPVIEGKCQFGEIVQKGDRVSIVGPSWSAEGRIRGGFVFVEWTQLATGKCGLGLYKIEDDKLTGHWGWETVCAFTDDDLCGEISGETLWITGP